MTVGHPLLKPVTQGAFSKRVTIPCFPDRMLAFLSVLLPESPFRRTIENEGIDVAHGLASINTLAIRLSALYYISIPHLYLRAGPL